jgi:hypothetical protein
MLTYADELRQLAEAEQQERMLTYAGVCSRMQAYADVC